MSLYPDLVEYLFTVMSDMEADNSRWHRSLVAQSQVSRMWRQVALSNRKFWARLVDFDKHSRQWNTELLNRSHPLPIDVTTYGYVARSPSAISAELSHLPRIRNYRISFDEDAFETLSQSLTFEAPHLSRLSLTNLAKGQDEPFILPARQWFLDGDAPSLRRLDLVQCSMDFRSPILRNLTSLCISKLSPPFAPTSSEWLEIIKPMKGLTKLSLQEAMSPQEPFDFLNQSSQPLIELASLQSLRLDDSLADVSSFLHHLSIPKDCSIDITASRCSANELQGLAVIVDAFRRGALYAHAVDNTFPLLIHAQGPSFYISNEPMDLEFDERVPSAKDGHQTLFLNLNTLESTSLQPIFASLIRSLGSVFEIATALELHLPDMSSDVLSPLTSATEVKTLTNLTALMTSKALQALQVVQGRDAVTGSELVPLPALDTICFTDDESMWGNAYSSFVSFLRWRAEHGRAIKKIEFKNCVPVQSRMENLREMGIEVECDLSGDMEW